MDCNDYYDELDKNTFAKWRKSQDYDETYYPRSTTSNWDWNDTEEFISSDSDDLDDSDLIIFPHLSEDELEEYHREEAEKEWNNFIDREFPLLRSLGYNDPYEYFNDRFPSALFDQHTILNKKELKQVIKELGTNPGALNWISIIVPNHFWFYCKNGESVEYVDHTKDTITVSYKGKEYVRPINILGEKLFIGNPLLYNSPRAENQSED